MPYRLNTYITSPMRMPYLRINPGSPVRRYLPAVAFFGGFSWDAVTLGRTIESIDLFILLGYYAGAAGILLLLGKGVRFKYSEHLNLALQFFLGGLFSALVIFYFLSSSSLPGFIFVGSLIGLLVMNEFLQKAYHRFTLSWTLFCFCGIMFFNFALPHLFRSIHPLWFYLSTSLALGAVLLLKRYSPLASGSIWPSAGVAGLAVLFFMGNFIPPVPLVKKNLIICRELVKKDGAYAAKFEKTSLWRGMPWWNGVLHQRPGEKIFCFSSIFAPPGLSTTIFHRWQYFDEKKDQWVKLDRLPFSIHGGRKEGYRGYTYKQNLQPGRWKVTVELEKGQVLGNAEFTLKPAEVGMKLVFSDQVLN